MKNLLLLTLILVLFFSNCKQQDKNWKQLDAKNFTIEVPSSFKCEKQEGIDAQLGRILGDSLEISFGYGPYMEQTPLTNEEYVQKVLFRATNIEEKFSRLFSEELDEAEISKNAIIESFDSINGEIKVSYRGKLASFEIPMYYDQDDDRRNYIFQIDTFDNWRRKIYFPKNSFGKSWGVVLKKEFKSKLFKYHILSLSIYNSKPKDSLKIMRILKSIRIKEQIPTQ